MRLAYFITHFPYKNNTVDEGYAVGGAEAVAYNLSSVLAERDHKISIFTTSANSTFETEEYNNIKIFRYGTNFRIASGIFSMGLLKDPIKYSSDIVHGHVSVPMGEIAGLRYAKKNHIPFIVTYHGDILNNTGGLIRTSSAYLYNKYFLNKILSYADIIITPSAYYVNESKVLSRYQDKVVTIPNGLNIDEFDIHYSKEECRAKLGIPLDDKVILFVGALAEHKGTDVLLKAMPKILKNISKAKLILIGTGKLRNDLERLGKKQGIEKSLQFTGYIGNTSTKALYYRAADVFVLPSRMESFGIVLLEASASGLPLITSNLDTFKCIINENYNGIFTRKSDKKDLADKIIYLLENREIRNKMGKNARKKVNEYSWEKIALETEKIYHKVIS